MFSTFSEIVNNSFQKFFFPRVQDGLGPKQVMEKYLNVSEGLISCCICVKFGNIKDLGETN